MIDNTEYLDKEGLKHTVEDISKKIKNKVPFGFGINEEEGYYGYYQTNEEGNKILVPFTSLSAESTLNKVTSIGDNPTNIEYPSAKAVKDYVDSLPEPMIFKGTLGNEGTITSLPSASTSNIGYTYKVITEGTYASQSAKVGDVFISNGESWVLIPSGDETGGTIINTAGSANKVDTKMFLVGTTSQTDGIASYSNVNCYIGTDNELYSAGKKVAHTEVELTQAEYDALSEAEKKNGTIYYIKDGVPNNNKAINVITSDGSNVQDKLDNLENKFPIDTSAVRHGDITLENEISSINTNIDILKAGQFSDDVIAGFGTSNQMSLQSLSNQINTNGQFKIFRGILWNTGTEATMSNVIISYNMYLFIAMREFDSTVTMYGIITNNSGINYGKISGFDDFSFLRIDTTNLKITFPATGYWIYSLIKIGNHFN